MTYRDAAALSANYARVFTPELKAAVAAAKADDLFAREIGLSGARALRGRYAAPGR
jgi:hypothetical protein